MYVTLLPRVTSLSLFFLQNKFFNLIFFKRKKRKKKKTVRKFPYSVFKLKTITVTGLTSDLFRSDWLFLLKNFGLEPKVN